MSVIERARNWIVKKQGNDAASVSEKHALKCHQSNECELIIGLDFGTSASKVVIQAPDLPGQPSYAVDFGQFHKSMPHILPTRLWMDSKGTFSITPKSGAQLINNIKLDLFLRDERLGSMHSPIRQQLPPEEIAAIYLALLLRFSRTWFLQAKNDVLRHFNVLRWSVNMGVPSPCIEDNEQNRVFRRVGRAAWMLSNLAKERITFERAGIELERADDIDQWESDELACDFDIIPEIAAGAVGYALSNLRREGLHVMVDIGASTVDACTFVLHAQEGSDHYRLLMADVQPLGTIRLYDDQLVALMSAYEEHIESLRDKHEPWTPIPEEIDPYLLARDQLIAAVQGARAQLKSQLLHMLRRVIWQTKLRRDPKAPVWRRGRLPILLIGGGSKLQFFRQAVEELGPWLKYHTRNDGTLLVPVPVPHSLAHSTDKADGHHFLTVAWGLSHRALDVGDITPADRIPDVEPPRPLDLSSRYIGKELV